MSVTPTDLALALSAYADDGCQGNAGGHGQPRVSVPMGMRFALEDRLEKCSCWWCSSW